ncbi:MAG: hypothetical protein ACFB02_04110 [Mastigocoleus sp.]
MSSYNKSGLERIIGSFSTQEAAKKALKLIQKHKPLSEGVSLRVKESNSDSSVIRTQLAQALKGAIVGGFLLLCFGLTLSLLVLSVNQKQTFISDNPTIFVSAIALISCIVGCLVFGSICGFYEVLLLKLEQVKLLAFTRETTLSRKYLLIIQGSEADVSFAAKLLRQYTEYVC